MSKPSIPKGTRDFLPQVMVKRNYIFNTIKKAFIKYGFLPIETPSMENLTTLTGKYGEEGDRLIFKILDRGDKLMRGLEQVDANSMSQGKIEHTICTEALRYDLTVPFARFVVQNQNDLTFPFKRYQIQPVWRADRPAKARYREFYQCDADVVGSDSLLFEVELIQLFDEVLSNLGLTDFSIKVNNRKILSGIAEITGLSDKIIDITVAIDKLDKIGEDGVIKELVDKGIPSGAIDKIRPLFIMTGNINSVITEMKTLLASSEVGLKGIEELEYVFDKINHLGLEKAKLEFDVTLARGLNYYTGAIFEVKSNEVSIGSICGGGRYDDLTGIFGMKDLSGVGISFGADRIYDVLEELNLFPESSEESTQLLLINFGVKENECLKILQRFREDGVNTELYPEAAKLKKQMKYADGKGIPYVLFLGEEELNSGIFQIKNLHTGDQKQASLKEIIADLS